MTSFAFLGTSTSTVPGPVQCDRQGNLTPCSPLLLGRVLVCCTGVVGLPPDVERCRPYFACHGEASEVDRH